MRIGLIAFASALVLSGCSPAAKKARYLSRADRYFKAGEYEQAKIEYLNVLRLDPKNVAALQQIGFIWAEDGDLLLALRFLSRARGLAPDNLAVESKLGSVLLSLGDATAARKEALAMLKLSPGNADAILLLSEASLNRPDLENTEQELQKFPDQGNGTFQLALGNLLFRKADPENAEKALTRALTADPKSPAFHLALASFSLTKKDLAKAEVEFKTAAELSPPRGPARLQYAESKLRSGAAEEAKAILTDISKKAPDYLPAWLLQAKIALSEKKPDDALAFLAKVLSRANANLDARLLRAQIWQAEGDVKKAIDDLEDLSKTYASLPPLAPLLKYRLAQFYLQAGNTTQAAALLSQAVDLRPKYTDAILLLAEVNLRTGNAPPVVTAMSALLKAQPGSSRARLLLAGAYRALGKYDESMAVFRSQIELTPRDPEPYFMLGLSFRQQGKLAEARKAFDHAQELASEDLSVTDQLVDLDLLAKDFAAAQKRVAAQIQQQPKSARARYLQGKIEATQKDWPHAEETLLQALDLDPDFAPSYTLLTSVYLAQKKVDQAIKELQAYLVKSPKDTRSLMLLGSLYDTTQQFPKSQEVYERLVSLNPNFAPALNNLAYGYAERHHDLDKALDFAKRARALQAENQSVADTLGWILYRKGDYAQALNLLRESASKTPVAPEILYHFGMANYMMDQPDAARTALQQALSDPRDFPGKTEIPSRLALLGENAGQQVGRSPEELEAILQKQPSDIFAQAALGQAWEAQGDWAKAAAAYEKALTLNPNLLSITLKLAQLNARPLHNPEKASELARKARTLSPSDPVAAGILGGIAYRKGELTQAYNLLQEALKGIKNDADAAPALHDFAWVAYSQGNVQDARAAMQRVFTASPNSAEGEDAGSFLAMTDLDENPKSDEETNGRISTLLKTAPDYVPALMAQAHLREQRGDAPAAIDGYASVLRHFPDFSPAQKRLATLYLQDSSPGGKPGRVSSQMESLGAGLTFGGGNSLGDASLFSQAKDSGSEAMAYDLAKKGHQRLPGDVEWAQILAQISFRRKEYAYAVQLLEESANRRPLDAKSLYVLGMSLRETKEIPKSKEALQRAVAAGLSGPESAEAHRILSELEKQ